MKNRFDETHFSGGHDLAIPVRGGVVDYEEQYHLTAEQYRAVAADLAWGLDVFRLPPSSTVPTRP
jgi:hypothetical protein